MDGSCPKPLELGLKGGGVALSGPGAQRSKWLLGTVLSFTDCNAPFWLSGNWAIFKKYCADGVGTVVSVL